MNPKLDPSPSLERRESCPAIRAPSTANELEAFYLEYFSPLVRRVIRRHTLSSEDAYDIVQEAFVVAIAKLDASRNPKAWLYQVVDHLATNHHRKLARRARLTAHWGTSPDGFKALKDPIDEL